MSGSTPSLLTIGVLLAAIAILLATCVQARRVDGQIDEAARLVHDLPRTIEYCGNPRCTCGRVCRCCRCP